MAGPEDLYAPQIPGSQNADVMTPGSAVANTLQQILAQKYARQQQDMIQQITNQHWQQQYDLQKQAADREQAWREAEGRRADAQAQKIANDEAATQKRNQGISEWAHTMGLGPTAAGGGPITPEEQAMYGFMEKFPDKSEPLMQAYLSHLMTNEQKGEMVPGYYMDEVLKSIKPQTDTAGKPIMYRRGDPNAMIKITRPNETAPPAKPLKDYLAGVDPKTNANVWMGDLGGGEIVPYILQNGQKTQFYGDVSHPQAGGGGRINGGLFTPAEINQIQKLRSGHQEHGRYTPGAAPTPNSSLYQFFGGAATKTDAGARAAWKNQATAMINSHQNIPDPVKVVATHIVNDDGSEGHSVDELVSAQSGLDASSKTILKNVLSAVRGEVGTE